MEKYTEFEQTASQLRVTDPITAALVHAGQVKLLLERAWRTDAFSARRRATIRRLCDVLSHLSIAIEHLAGTEVRR